MWLTLSYEQRVRLECYECNFENDTYIDPNLPLAEGHINCFGHGHFRFTRSTCGEKYWENFLKLKLAIPKYISATCLKHNKKNSYKFLAENSYEY